MAHPCLMSMIHQDLKRPRTLPCERGPRCLENAARCPCQITPSCLPLSPSSLRLLLRLLHNVSKCPNARRSTYPRLRLLVGQQQPLFFVGPLAVVPNRSLPPSSCLDDKLTTFTDVFRRRTLSMELGISFLSSFLLCRFSRSHQPLRVI